MPAPMFTVHGTQNSLLTADPAHAGPGLWTDSPPDYLTDTVVTWPIGTGSTPGHDPGRANPAGFPSITGA